MDVLNKKLLELEKQYKNANDVSIVLPEISQKIKGSIYAAVQSANETESIDERIKILIGGLQSVINFITECETKVARDSLLLQNKISVIEEIVDELLIAEAQEE
tara:strand:- start:405 stop:716 length:312 start_codon:yes stop_codon:yes gene_type:complete